MTEILAAIVSVNATLSQVNSLAETVIKSQPQNVQTEMWNRFVVLTQPLYDALAKLAAFVDPNVKPPQP